MAHIDQWNCFIMYFVHGLRLGVDPKRIGMFAGLDTVDISIRREKQAINIRVKNGNQIDYNLLRATGLALNTSNATIHQKQTGPYTFFKVYNTRLTTLYERISDATLSELSAARYLMGERLFGIALDYLMG